MIWRTQKSCNILCTSWTDSKLVEKFSPNLKVSECSRAEECGCMGPIPTPSTFLCHYNSEQTMMPTHIDRNHLLCSTLSNSNHNPFQKYPDRHTHNVLPVFGNLLAKSSWHMKLPIMVVLKIPFPSPLFSKLCLTLVAYLICQLTIYQINYTCIFIRCVSQAYFIHFCGFFSTFLLSLKAMSTYVWNCIKRQWN